MLRIVFAIILGWLFTAVLNAQDLQGKISCWGQGSLKPQNRAHTKKLWDGYEISLGPQRNAHGDGDDCTAAVYNSGGRVVFRTTGFNVIFDEGHTGQDFDGDGKPEVVFITDSGGGNHCCWAFNVISLSPKPHKLFDIDNALGVRFEKDSQGKMIIWQGRAGPYDFTTEARAPGAKKVFRISEGKLADATPEFCSRIFSGENEDYSGWAANLTPENIKKLEATGALENFDNQDIVSGLLSRALQHVVCRQFDAALNDLDLWPEASRTKMKAAFARSIKQDYPEFAARLMPAGRPASVQTSQPPQAITRFLNLGNQERFLAAKLTVAERKQIIDQVEKTSFDVPNSWDAELRVRRVSLGESNGLVIRGTQLLCGGTGNCATWVFRRSQGNWFNLFEQEAPIVSEFGFAQEATSGIMNFLVRVNISAAKESRIVFTFDGKFYRQTECYDVSVDARGAD